jgi:hypothetical protein
MKTGLYSYLRIALKVELLKGSKKVIAEQAINAYVQGGDITELHKSFDIFNSFEDFEKTVAEATTKYQLDNTATITGDSYIEPVAEEVTPVAEEVTPVAEEVTPVVEEVTPVVEEVTPVAEEVTPVAEEVAPPVVEEVAPPVVEEVIKQEFIAKYKKRGINVVEEGLISDFWEDDENNFHQLLFINKEYNGFTLCKQTLVDFRQNNKVFVAAGNFERCEAVCLSMLIKSELNYLYITEDHKEETYKIVQDEVSA